MKKFMAILAVTASLLLTTSAMAAGSLCVSRILGVVTYSETGKCKPGLVSIPLSSVTNNSSVKPPAVFSADGKFLGYVRGNGDATNHIVVYNDGINYSFQISTGNGLIGSYWGDATNSTPWRTPYFTNNQCSEAYLYQYKLQDIVLGKADYGEAWPFNTNYVTTDSSQGVQTSQLGYYQNYEQLSEPLLGIFLEWAYPACTVEPCPPTPEPDCSQIFPKEDDYGNPLFKQPGEPYKCYGYRKALKFDSNNQPVFGLTCKEISQQTKDALVGLPPYHKVVPFDPNLLPFKEPVTLPLEIRTDY